MLNVFKAAKQIQNIMSIEIIVIKKALDSSFTVHHIATIRRPWPHIPEAAATVSHTGSEDSLVFLLPTSTASSLAFAPQQLGGMHNWRYTEANKRTDSCNK